MRYNEGDGINISNFYINKKGHLIAVRRDNMAEVDLGKVVGEKGATGERGPAGATGERGPAGATGEKRYYTNI